MTVLPIYICPNCPFSNDDLKKKPSLGELGINRVFSNGADPLRDHREQPLMVSKVSVSLTSVGQNAQGHNSGARRRRQRDAGMPAD